MGCDGYIGCLLRCRAIVQLQCIGVAVAISLSPSFPLFNAEDSVV
jgi:hypothetical protein